MAPPALVHVAIASLLCSALAIRDLGAQTGLEEGNQTETLQVKKAKLGEKCECGDFGLADNRCCDEGLICSKTAHVCKPAVGGACELQYVTTQCAVSTYGHSGGIICSNKRCCVEGLGLGLLTPPNVALANYRPVDEKASSCCSGKLSLPPHHWAGGGEADKANHKKFCA